MIKVIHVLSDTNIGGAGTLLVNYLKNFDKTKFLIKIVLPEGSLLKPRITALGYEVIEVKGLMDKSMDFKAIGKLKKIFKAEKPDIVHTHSSMSAKIAAYLSGVKSRIYTRHCAYDPPKYMTKFPFKQINGFINNTLATEIVAVAYAAKENLTDTGVSDKKITVIINGVEPLSPLSDEDRKNEREKYKITDDDFVFGIAARLEPVKGQEYFIKAGMKMAEKYKNVKFLLAGTGSDEERLKQLAQQCENIVFAGFVEDMAKFFSVIDVNVNCSYGTETSSLALSEGMSLARPAIASIYGGNPYMVTNGLNGILCEKQNTDELFKAMDKLYSDRELYRKMCANAYGEYLKKFTASNMTRQLEAIYESEYERINKTKGN